ncbi:CACTA en-spm transposon protein [Cucumis melo var. makuwa]|uniref:CACTA en-spm transposon protein n=1 Tax=Cucumis melo var. makuwa TaxID=1194695 RepID=A0A5D3D4H5_CUCMM|nr:CACTA en-spm transposon protein [Cucumis melo var. makuwa]
MSLTTSSTMWMNTCHMQAMTNYSDKPPIMSYRRNNFMETDDMFLGSEEDLDNIVGGSSSVGDNTELHVAINGRIPMTIAPEAEKPISPHAVRSLQPGDRRLHAKDISVRCLKCLPPLKSSGPTVTYISKSIATWRRLMQTHQTHWLDVMRIDTSSATTISVVHSRSNHRRTRLLDRSSLTIVVAGSSYFYNDSTSSLREKGSRPIGWSCSENTRSSWDVRVAGRRGCNQMLKLQSQPTLEGSQPLSEDEICDQVLGRRPGYSKGLGWGPKPKTCRTMSASSSSTSCSQSTEKEIELQAKLHEARNHQALASQVETMKKMIEELTRAQQGPLHDP